MDNQITEEEIEEIIEAAHLMHREYERSGSGVRGQVIRLQDDIGYWIVRATSDVFRASLAAERERAKTAEARIKEIEEILKNPVSVHVNMLCGSIARPSWEAIKHIYAGEMIDYHKEQGKHG